MSTTECDSQHGRSSLAKKLQKHFTWSASGGQNPPKLESPSNRERQHKASVTCRSLGSNKSLSRSQSVMLSHLDSHLSNTPTLSGSFSCPRTKTKQQQKQHKDHHHSTHSGSSFEDVYGYENYLEEPGNLDSSEKGTSSLWGEFENHILSIDTDSVHFQNKPSTWKGSVKFREAMEEEYKLKQAFGKTVGTVVNVNRFKDNLSCAILQEEAEEMTSEGSDASLTSPEASNVTNASRCWNKVKIDLQEHHLENKLAEETTGWNLVQRTNFNINNPSDVRQELYNKYLRRSRQWWLGGLQNYEKYKLFFEGHGSSASNASSDRKKMVTLSSKSAGHLQERHWFKSQHKRPMTSRSGYRKPEASGLDTNRPMTALESVS